jgi:hypothetical protein
MDHQKVPQWVQAIFVRQQELLERLDSQLQETTRSPLEPEYLPKFAPSGHSDDIDYFLFSERITDLVNQFGENRVLASLPACLTNTRAKNWYISLSNFDKTLLRASTFNWQVILKRDFGIRAFRAKQLAEREKFSFKQNRGPPYSPLFREEDPASETCRHSRFRNAVRRDPRRHHGTGISCRSTFKGEWKHLRVASKRTPHSGTGLSHYLSATFSVNCPS